MTRKIARFEPEVKLKYEKEMITERDYYNMLNTAKADGRADGLAEGLAEGEAKGRTEGIAEGISRVAKKMLKSGMSAEMIASVTGLTKAQIAAL